MLAAEAADQMAGYLIRSLKKRPEVTLKLAISADGMIGRQGEGQVAITGTVRAAQVHLMRAESDAILVGIGTALADDPELTVRLPGLESRSPIRIVLDPRRGCRSTSKLASSAGTVPVWSPLARMPTERAVALERAGVRFIGAELYDGALALPELLEDLAAQGISTVLVEGGAKPPVLFWPMVWSTVSRCSTDRSDRRGWHCRRRSTPTRSRPDSGWSARTRFGDDHYARMDEGALMFTGIVTDVGTVGERLATAGGRAPAHRNRLRPGDHRYRRLDFLRGRVPDGVALPEVGSNARWFEVEAWEEALRLTTASAGAPARASIWNAR